jgi:tetratricopeptide (TPR) repeat protein
MTSAAILTLLLALPAATSEITVPHRTSAGSVDPHYQRALAHDRRGDFVLAAAEYRLAAARSAAILRRALYHATLSADIALYESRLKDNRSYVSLFQAAVQIQNKYWGFLVEFGEPVPRLFERAEKLFVEALRADVFAANPVVCLAALYVQAGEPKKADDTIALLKTRAIREPDEYNFAFYLALRGDLDRAFNLLERVVARDPRQVDWILESDDFNGLYDHPRLVRLIDRFRPPRSHGVK